MQRPRVGFSAQPPRSLRLGGESFFEPGFTAETPSTQRLRREE